MDKIIKTVENIAHEWKDFEKSYENQEKRVKSLELEVNNLKGEKSNMEDMPIFGLTAETKESDNLGNFLKGSSSSLEYKAFSSGDAERGAFAVSPERYKDVIAKIAEISIFRKLASCETISSNVLELLVQDGVFNGGWVAETEARNETAAPKLLQKRIHVHEVYAQPKATQRLLDDTFVNIEEWLTQQIVETFSSFENAAFISGDGANKPKGFLAYFDELGKVRVEEEEALKATDLINLLNSLEDRYQPNASFLMNRRTLAHIQRLKDENGRFIWQPSLSEKAPNTIFGIPVYCSSDMPVPEAGRPIIALGDFKAGYKIVDRQGISLVKDPYTEKPFIKFYATKRVGGDVVDLSAIKLLTL